MNALSVPSILYFFFPQYIRLRLSLSLPGFPVRVLSVANQQVQTPLWLPLLLLYTLSTSICACTSIPYLSLQSPPKPGPLLSPPALVLCFASSSLLPLPTAAAPFTTCVPGSLPSPPGSMHRPHQTPTIWTRLSFRPVSRSPLFCPFCRGSPEQQRLSPGPKRGETRECETGPKRTWDRRDGRSKGVNTGMPPESPDPTVPTLTPDTSSFPLTFVPFPVPFVVPFLFVVPCFPCSFVLFPQSTAAGISSLSIPGSSLSLSLSVDLC